MITNFQPGWDGEPISPAILLAGRPKKWRFLHRARYVRNRSRNPPFFVMGCGHSGTTLLQAILDSHSRIYAIPKETALADRLVPADPAARAALEHEIAQFDFLTIQAGKWRWVEKTPLHVRRLDRLLDFFPASKMIILLRDGRDVAVSLRERHGDLGAGIRRWVEDNRAGQRFWTDPRVYVLRYEDLVTDFERSLTSVLEFIGERYEKRMRDYHLHPRFYKADRIEKPADGFGPNHAPFRNWQINQPLFDGRGKWTHLSAEEKAVIKAHAGDMLIEYGYATSQDW